MVCGTQWHININYYYNSSENIIFYVTIITNDPYSQLYSSCLKHYLAHDKHLISICWMNKWMLLKDILIFSVLIKSLFWISMFENFTSQIFFLYLYNWLWLTTKTFLCIREFLLTLLFFPTHENFKLGLKSINITSNLIKRADGYIFNIFLPYFYYTYAFW